MSGRTIWRDSLSPSALISSDSVQQQAVESLLSPPSLLPSAAGGVFPIFTDFHPVVVVEDNNNFTSVEQDGPLFNIFENGTTEEYNLYDEFYPEDEHRVSFGLGIFFCIAYGIVFIIGVVGNSFVVAVVMRSPRMKTPTNFFIVNLALADLLVLIFCLPVTLIGNIYSGTDVKF